MTIAAAPSSAAKVYFHDEPAEAPLGDIAAKLKAGVDATHRFDKAATSVYDQRFRNHLTPKDQYLFDHPKMSKALFNGAFVGGFAVFVGGWLGGMAVVIGMGHHLIGVGMGAAGLVTVVGSMPLIDYLRPVEHASDHTSQPLERLNLQPLMTLLRDLPRDEASAVRSYVRSWATWKTSVHSIGAQAELELEAMLETAKPQPIFAEAVQLVRDDWVNGNGGTYINRVIELLERTPVEKRRELADALRSHMFDGDQCKIRYCGRQDGAKLYKRLCSYGIVSTKHDI